MAVVAAALMGLLLAVGAAPASAAPIDGEAFGVAGQVTLDGAPVVTIDPIPAVACPPDEEAEVIDLQAPEVGPLAGLLAASALNVTCQSDDDLLEATATVAGLDLAGAVTAELVTSECTANGGVGGSSELVDLVILGEPVEVAADPNTEIELPAGLGTITLNRQTITTDDAGNETIVVEAVVIDLAITIPPPGTDLPPELVALLAQLPQEIIGALPVGTVIGAEVVVASVTCTAGEDDGPPATTPPGTIPITTPPGGTVAPPPPVGELPRTGSSSTVPMVGLGLGLLAAGALSLAASRRRGAPSS